MERKVKIATILSTTFLVISCSSHESERRINIENPNLIFILVDDMGWKDLGCYGSTYYETPFIDQLAEEGIRFTSAYAAASICSPTRASIATGKYPARLHLTAFIPGQERPFAKLAPVSWTKYLKLSELTYAEVLKNEGYKTFHAGKWHLGRIGPEAHGFEVVVKEQGWKAPPQDPKHVNLYTDATLKFIGENKDSPFLAVVSHNTVHVPLEEKDSLINKYSKKAPGDNGQNNPVMAAMIETLDKSVGRIIQGIKELKLENRTYIIFFSDNGGLMNVGDRIATSNLPLRGGKSQFYEGGIRVPFIIQGPDIPKNKEIAFPVISNDLFPTMLGMAGIPLHPDLHLDGINLQPFINDEAAIPYERDLFWHHPHYQTLAPHGAVRSGPWKLIEHYEDNRIELFNLENDLGEKNNLAEEEPLIAELMRKKLHDHLVAVNAQIPKPNPDFDPDKQGRGFSEQGEYDEEEFQQPGYE